MSYASAKANLLLEGIDLEEVLRPGTVSQEVRECVEHMVEQYQKLKKEAELNAEIQDASRRIAEKNTCARVRLEQEVDKLNQQIRCLMYEIESLKAKLAAKAGRTNTRPSNVSFYGPPHYK